MVFTGQFHAIRLDSDSQSENASSRLQELIFSVDIMYKDGTGTGLLPTNNEVQQSVGWDFRGPGARR